MGAWTEAAGTFPINATLGAAVITITLNGTPIPTTVDIYLLAPPVVEPEQAAPADADPEPIMAGVLIGAVTACTIGALMAGKGGDNDVRGACLVGAGAGALFGWLVAA